jgi:hypothetical protein
MAKDTLDLTPGQCILSKCQIWSIFGWAVNAKRKDCRTIGDMPKSMLRNYKNIRELLSKLKRLVKALRARIFFYFGI